jgi:hypothetical protein
MLREQNRPRAFENITGLDIHVIKVDTQDEPSVLIQGEHKFFP